jgi:hypothetical protein
LLCVATRLDWLSIQYLPTLDMKVGRFYELVQYLQDAFVPQMLTRCVDARNLSTVKHWLGGDILRALAERNGTCDVWHSNPNIRVKGDRFWGIYAEKRRFAGRLSDASYSRLVEVNLIPDVPPIKLFNNFREPGVIMLKELTIF